MVKYVIFGLFMVKFGEEVMDTIYQGMTLGFRGGIEISCFIFFLFCRIYFCLSIYRQASDYGCLFLLLLSIWFLSNWYQRPNPTTCEELLIHNDEDNRFGGESGTIQD